MRRDKAGELKFDEMLERMDKPGAVPASPQETVVKRYRDLRKRATDLSVAADDKVPKYGKFVYTRSGGEVTVFRKYENGRKTMRVLYQGPV